MPAIRGAREELARLARELAALDTIRSLDEAKRRAALERDIEALERAIRRYDG